jgi:hypothetical protein
VKPLSADILSDPATTDAGVERDGSASMESGPVRRAHVLLRLTPAFTSSRMSDMNARTLLVAISLVAVTACSPRQVDVRTAPTTQAQVSVQVNNTLTQAVNVYVTSAGTDTFLKQVGAKSSATIPVQGFAPGTTVSLKAVTLDGVKTYARDNVTLSGTYVFPLP